ncbi:MAG: RING finger domain-containing protein [Candidatus Babeliales bacterium]|jgi:hypothetical protein
MKKSLLLTLLTLTAFQVSSKVYTMKQDQDETSKKRDREDQSREGKAPDATRSKQDAPKGAEGQDPEGAAQIAVPAAAAASAEAAENRCGICFNDFGSKNEAGQVVTQIKLPCCSYTICEKCLEDALKTRPVCPQCSEPISNLKMLKDKIVVAMMQRKIKEKKDRIKKEHEEARGREKREQETARIQEQIRKFSSGEDITAYVDVPGDTLVNVSFILKLRNADDEGLTVSTQLPILHFLAKGGPDGHDEFKDAFELVKYFVEEKHANINQKVRVPDQTKRFYGRGVFGIDEFFRINPFQEDNFVELTPLEIAEVYGNHSIAAYLRGKIAEQQAAQAREAAERHAPPEKCAIQ